MKNGSTIVIIRSTTGAIKTVFIGAAIIALKKKQNAKANCEKHNRKTNDIIMLIIR